MQESPKELRLTLAADILFDFDKSTILPDGQAALERVALIIRSKSRGVIRIDCFTDSKGTPDYNLRLSTACVRSVENWLIGQSGLHGAGFDRGDSARPGMLHRIRIWTAAMIRFRARSLTPVILREEFYKLEYAKAASIYCVPCRPHLSGTPGKCFDDLASVTDFDEFYSDWQVKLYGTRRI